MEIKNESFTILTRGFDDTVDITSKIINLTAASNIKEGFINVFTSSSASGFIITEQEPGIVEDVKKLVSFMIPVNKMYEHDLKWHEGNGFSYLRAVFFPKNIIIPVISGTLKLGKYQQIVFIDFDNKSSSREIIVTISGQAKEEKQQQLQ